MKVLRTLQSGLRGIINLQPRFMEYNYGNFEANKRLLESQNIDWKNKRVLEIGCGNGSLTEYLFDKGAKVTAIDLSEKYLLTARERFRRKIVPEVFVYMSGDELKFPAESFDYVVSFDLIEHIPDTKKHLEEVKRVLKNSGKYFFQTPNKIPSALFAICRDKSFAYRKNHPSLHTRKSLKSVAAEVGFEVEFLKIDYFTEWYRNKLPRPLRSINPQKFGFETNNFGVMTSMTKSEHILDIVTTPYLIPKGSSLRVDSVLKKLARENQVDVLTYPVGEDTDYENVNIFRVNSKKDLNLGVSEISLKKIILDLKVLAKGLSLLRKNNYDIVHCEDFEAGFAGAVLSLFFKEPQYVYDLHNTIVDNLRITNKPKILIKVFEVISKFVYSRYDMIIANWKIYEKVGKKKTFLLYDESNTEIEKINIPTKNKYMAYSGNFKKYQGVENFLSVYSKVMPKFDVILVGDPTDEIVSFVKELKLEKKVHFTGVLDIKESNYILSNAEFCLIPRISGDQPGLKMIHHIMLGKVSVASNIPANTEILKDGYNSVLYKDGKDLEGILRDIDERNIQGGDFKSGIEETQRVISDIWSYEYFVNNYSKVYEKKA